MEKKIRRQTLHYGVVAIVLAVMLGAFCYNFGLYLRESLKSELPSPALSSSFLSTFPSLDTLKNFLKSSGAQWSYPAYWFLDANILAPSGMRSETYQSSGKTMIDFSSTNVQVAGVDEADIVKTDGEYIYVLSNCTVAILQAYPAETARLISRITFDELYPYGIFVNGDHLAVLGSRYLSSRWNFFEAYEAEARTFIYIYDISERSSPVLLRDLSLTGYYFNSRMRGDYVYLVASQPAYLLNDNVILPKFYSDDQTREIAPSEIHYSNVSDSYYQYTTFVALNLHNATEAPTYLTIMLGQTSNMYVSLDNIYVTFRANYGNTTIYRVHYEANNMTAEAQGEVPGYELNQFSMDEYDSHFRIVTTAWTDGNQRNNLYVLTMNLTVFGRLENLGMGEDLHSARFMGHRCYLVTFKKIDPLFVIDLTEPSAPTVLGELKIPGYSDYLHPFDETHIIGVGKETVEAEQGFFAWYQGIKISLFDVSNVSDPKQIANYIIGDRGSNSPVLDDHKAFLFDKSKNLLVIPALVAKVDESAYPGGVPANAYGTPVWQGAYVFNLTIADGFALRGRITHGQDGAGVPGDSYWIERSLYIENVLYTMSDMKIKMNNLADLTTIGEIELP